MTLYLYISECRYGSGSSDTVTTPSLCKSSIIITIIIVISCYRIITFLTNTIVINVITTIAIIINAKAIGTSLDVYIHVMNNRLWAVDLHPSLHKCIIVYRIAYDRV